MMPADEVEISKTYKDQYGLKIMIEAGHTGWSVLWADYSADSEVNHKSAKENLQAAIKFVQEQGFKLTEVGTHTEEK